MLEIIKVIILLCNVQPESVGRAMTQVYYRQAECQRAFIDCLEKEGTVDIIGLSERAAGRYLITCIKQGKTNI